MRRATQPRDERGVTLVIVALSMTGLLAVAALAIDGGRLFTARRQTQNATDTAALAGAQALFAYQYADVTGGTPDPTTIYAAVAAKLSQNQAAAPGCWLTDQHGNPLSLCSGATDAQLVGAHGVQAGGNLTQHGAFSGIVGVNQYSASSISTATIQPIASVGSPFVVCGAANLGWNFLNPDNTINISAAEQLQNIPLEWSQLGKAYDCNAPSSKFKGLASQNDGLVGPGQYESITNGNRYSASVANQVAGQTPCPADISTLVGTCDLIIPIASAANTDPSNPQLLVVNFAMFQVSATNNAGGVKYTGSFILPSALAGLGSGVFGATCQVGSGICVAKLVQ